MNAFARIATLAGAAALLVAPAGAPADPPAQRPLILIRGIGPEVAAADPADADRAIKQLEEVIRGLKDDDRETREQLERALKLLKERAREKGKDAKAREAEVEKARAEARQAAEELKKAQEQVQAAATRFARAQQKLAELQGRERLRFELKVRPPEMAIPTPPLPVVPGAGDRTRDLEKKLDELTRQVEELRRELRKAAPKP